MIKKALNWVLCAVLACACGVASAAYPDRTINLLVPFTAGGTSDILARMLAEHLQKAWGVAVIVQNKPGAGGTIDMLQVMRAAPDGYTLTLTSSGTATINPHLYKKPPYDTDKNFVNIIMMVDLPFVLTVDAKSPIKTLADYLVAAKAKPGTISLGSAGVGSHQYLANQQFVAAAGIKLNLIPYKGTPQQIVDLFGGTLDSMMDNVATEIPIIKQGKVRPLAISSTRRIPQLPNVPTFAEAGVQNFVSIPWYGLAAPIGTPKDVVAKLQKETAAFLNDPATRKKLNDLGVVPVGGSTKEATQRVAAENKEFNSVIKKLGLRLQ